MWFSGAEVDAGQALDQRGERKWESIVWGRRRFKQKQPKLETNSNNKPSAKFFHPNNPFLPRRSRWRG
jgi:hypothetical protein